MIHFMETVQMMVIIGQLIKVQMLNEDMLGFLGVKEDIHILQQI